MIPGEEYIAKWLEYAAAMQNEACGRAQVIERIKERWKNGPPSDYIRGQR